MKLDSVSVVVKYTKKLHTDGSYYEEATFLPEHVYYGRGAAYDAQEAIEAADRLNGIHKTPDRYYGAVRLDYDDAKAEGLI